MLVSNDLLDALYLGSFLFGVIFSAISVVLGRPVGGHGHLHAPRLPLPHGGHPGVGGHQGHVAGRDDIGILNGGALLAFLAWFGGIGYLARHALGLQTILHLIVGVVGGLIAGATVSWVLTRLVHGSSPGLDPADYRLPGTIARVTNMIRPGGTGEIVYVQHGIRQVSAARAANDEAVPRGTEVVILDCAHGVALVQPWQSLIGADGSASPAINPVTHPRTGQVA